MSSSPRHSPEHGVPLSAPPTFRQPQAVVPQGPQMEAEIRRNEPLGNSAVGANAQQLPPSDPVPASEGPVPSTPRQADADDGHRRGA